jgi:RNA polymerase sigma-70 factor (ECF subfamily)
MARSHTDPAVVPPATLLAPATGQQEPPDPDLAWVRAAAAGRMEAWARLYQAHYAPVFRHVRYMGGEHAPVEDLVQEVFARALVGLSGFDGRSTFSTWLHGIAVNLVRNHWRSSLSTRTAHQRLRDIQEVHRPTAAVAVDRRHAQKQRAAAVYAILETLPEHLREAFVLRDLEGLSPADAAAQLGISPGNLSVRATRARDRIRRELEAQGWLAPRTGAES